MERVVWKMLTVEEKVTRGATKLSKEIGKVELVICTMGFYPSLDFLAPWKANNFGTVNLVDAC